MKNGRKIHCMLYIIIQFKKGNENVILKTT